MENNLKNQVISALNQIRPNLQADGGDIEFIELNDKVVKVKLQGACAGCPMSQITLKQGVENYLRENVDSEIIVEQIENE